MKTASLLVLLFLAPLAAQTPATITVAMKDGRLERIQPLELNGDVARYKVFVLGGEMTCTRKLSAFEPDSAFQIEAIASQPKTFDDHFRLARKAADLDLIGPAGAQARKAAETVQGTAEAAAKVAELRKWAADTLEAKVAAAVAAKDTRTASHLLKLLTTRLADQRSEEQLAALAESVDALEEEVAGQQRVERQAKLDAKVRDDIERRLKPIYERIKQGDKLQKAGIAQSRNTVASARQCEQSIESYKAAWKATQALGEKYPADEELAQEVQEVGKRLQGSAIRSALHAANMLTVQSDYKGAMDWTTKILNLDPDNAEAKEMMRTIQIASAAASSQWGWDWSIVGGSGGAPKPKR